MSSVVIYILLLCIALLGIITGLLSISKPIFVIKVQQRFYSKINWRIEPISFEREVRNTKIMGYFSLIIGCLIALLIFIRLF